MFVRWFSSFLMLSISFSSLSCTSASAEALVTNKTFMSLLIQNDIYNLVVISDEVSEDLNESLLEAFRDDPNLKMISKSLSLKGSLLSNSEEKINALEDSLKGLSPHVALIIIGTPDPISIRDATGKRLIFGTPDWRNADKEKVNGFLNILKKYNIAAYFVSLPPFRNTDANERARILNDVLRESVFINEMRYIDIYGSFLDDNGKFSAWGPDLDGKIIKIRNSDGQGFTNAGNFMLAHFIERELHKDIKEAQAIKLEPLIGTETDQRKINPEKTLLKSFNKDKSSSVTFEKLKGTTPYTFSGEDISADNDKVPVTSLNKMGREETITMDILRPSLSSAIVTLLSQKESEYKQKKINERLITKTKNGLTLLNTITLPRLEDVETGRNKIPPTQTSYYKLVIKGERLSSKPGRADEPNWPNP